jgi:hypothetical protein
MDGDTERHEGELRARLHHREGTPERRRVQAVLSRVDKLERDGVLADCECETWPDEVPVDRESRAVEVFRRYQDWAEEEGVSIQPPFRVASVDSSILHISDEMLRTPTLCLGVTVEDELRAVYPHGRDDEIVTVEEGLNEIATATWNGDSGVSDETGAGRSTGQPQEQSVNPV